MLGFKVIAMLASMAAAVTALPTIVLYGDWSITPRFYNPDDPSITIIHGKRPIPAENQPRAPYSDQPLRNEASTTVTVATVFPTGNPLQPSMTSGDGPAPATTAPYASHVNQTRTFLNYWKFKTTTCHAKAPLETEKDMLERLVELHIVRDTVHEQGRLDAFPEAIVDQIRGAHDIVNKEEVLTGAQSRVLNALVARQFAW
ncbi:hypothetical protein PG996_016106 [Apiospora saccharicola]|uniref:FAS1 domain-containing protein n=1 Tax=Apiospora saccharicola TaxID=335842 RepID=A0ABR1TN99_9PEZI